MPQPSREKLRRELRVLELAVQAELEGHPLLDLSPEGLAMVGKRLLGRPYTSTDLPTLLSHIREKLADLT